MQIFVHYVQERSVQVFPEALHHPQNVSFLFHRGGATFVFQWVSQKNSLSFKETSDLPVIFVSAFGTDLCSRTSSLSVFKPSFSPLSQLHSLYIHNIHIMMFLWHSVFLFLCLSLLPCESCSDLFILGQIC